MRRNPKPPADLRDIFVSVAGEDAYQTHLTLLLDHLAKVFAKVNGRPYTMYTANVGDFGWTAASWGVHLGYLNIYVVSREATRFTFTEVGAAVLGAIAELTACS